MTKFAPVHPRVVLYDEFVKPMGLSQYRLAKRINVPPRRINEIVLEKRAIAADTALRLGRFFGISAEPRLASDQPETSSLMLDRASLDSCGHD
jgi:addiction module HigA family antidote